MMKYVSGKCCVLGLALATSGTVLAEPIFEAQVSSGATLTAQANGAALSSLSPMNAQEMDETRGELWPLVGAIGAIVAVDLALQSYFWGTYVPSAGGGTCTSCSIPSPKPR